MVIARNQITITDIHDGQPSYTYTRYSNDGGKTFTEAKAVIEHMGEVYVDKKSGKDFTVVNVESRIPVDLVEAGQPYTVVWEAKSEDTQTDKAAIVLHSAKWGLPVKFHFTPAKEYKVYARTFIMPDFAKEGTYFFLRFDSNKVKTEGVTDRLYGRAFRIYRGLYTLDTISQLIGTTPGSWMGTVTWDKPYPPFDVTAYTWSKIKGEDGAPGTPAELYRLKAITERAVVNEEGTLSVVLQYAIEHTVGNNVTTLSATVGGYRVRWHGDNGTPGNSYLTDGDRPSATYTMAGYHNNQHRPSAVVAELVKGNTILDVKTVPVVFDAAASVTTAKDLSAITTTVQGHSKTLLGQAQQISNLVVGLDGIKGSVQSVEGSLKNYSTLEQTANGFKLMAKAVQQGLRNLLKGGNLHTTYYSYGMAESLTIDLEGGHTYTMTANGHVSQRIKDRHMDMRVMIFNKEWTHLKIIVIDSTTDTTASVTWDDMPTGQYFINAFPTPNDANNRDTITLNWVTVTEGNVPMSQWRATEAEEDEAWVGMGIDRKNKSISLKGDTTITDADGKKTALFKDGKISAQHIDADKVVANGFQGKTIDAKNATFENVNIKGNLVGVEGTFRALKCFGGAASLRLGEGGQLTISDGDLYMQGDWQGRTLRFYSSNIWCRGAFGALERTTIVVRGATADCYVDGIDEEPISVPLESDNSSKGKIFYKVPCYNPGAKGPMIYEPRTAGFPVDTILFNVSGSEDYFYELAMAETQRCILINSNYQQSNVVIYTNGHFFRLNGGSVIEAIQLPAKVIFPAIDSKVIGGGLFITNERNNGYPG